MWNRPRGDRGGGQGDLLSSSIIQSDSIKKAFFLMVFVIGAILLVVFTIIAIIKTSYQEKHELGECP
jgi:uncharacterized membrane protein YjfL (UPF0719 family)